MKQGKKLRKKLIKLQNRLGKNEGKSVWREMKKENNIASLSQESS